MSHLKYDVIIVGGGVVGLTLACALAQQTSLSIAVLESQPETPLWEAHHYHHRVSAISLASQRIFRALQVWDAMKAKRVSPFKAISVWDDSNQQAIHFDGQTIAEPLLGHVIENNVMQSALIEKANTYPQITRIAPIRLTTFRLTATAAELATDDNRCFTAKLIIAADGARSWLREQAAIAITQKDYAQTAIVAAVETSHPHQQTARQVFLPDGPLAFLPLASPTLSSIVWSLPAEAAIQTMALNDDTFKQSLTTAFASRLGDVTSVSQRYTFPLQTHTATQYVQPRLALIGDAAHTVHPLAGQGVNMGLLDAASLVEVIRDAIHQRRDFASLATLRRYERWRKADNQGLLLGIDWLKRFFANPSTQTLRETGLKVTNRFPPLKNLFIRHAVGNRDGLPFLAR